MTAGKRLGALVLALLMAACTVLSAGMAPRDSGRRLFQPGLIIKKSGEVYRECKNGNVKFAFEAPAEYEVTEPYDNVTMVTDGDDFRVSVEYAFTTADSAHFLRNASDFAALIEADRTVLTDWVGSEDLEVQFSGWGDLDGTPCYVVAYDLDLNGKSYAGGLYLFDGQGSFGCYCMQALINRNAEKVEKYIEQQEQIVRSFEITGAYQAEGYAYYTGHLEGVPLEFFAQDAARVEAYSSSICIYPVDGVYSEANVDIMKTVWDISATMDRVVEGVSDYYFKYWDNTRYTAQPSRFDLGRYSYEMISMESYDDGERYTVYIAVFISDGNYYKVTAKFTDEYAGQMAAAFSDTLFSLCMNDDGPMP